MAGAHRHARHLKLPILNMRKIDLVGKSFGRLTVIEMLTEKGKDTKARCLCVCGKERVALAYNVRNGNTSSCGCLARERSSERARHAARLAGDANRKHGMSTSPTYVAWRGAINRCYRLKDKRYSSYGGRGISMCEEWRASFEAFLRDMGPAPDGMTLDRIDVNGNYEPCNCRWATRVQQARNTRANVATEEISRQIRCRHARGESTKSLAEEFGMTKGNVWHIISESTWKAAPHRSEKLITD